MVARQELIRGDDGMWLWWPAGWNKGALASNNLRALAARIDAANRENAKRLADGLRKKP